MTLSTEALAIGITAPFGSGSTTAAESLSQRMKMKFKHCKLSDLLVARWRRENPRSRAKRPDLQSLGNRVRWDAKDPGALVQQALQILARKRACYKRLVFDGIRNLGEVERLRATFGQRFYLFAVECPASERWERMRHTYESQKKTMEDFTVESERDRDQEDPFGQQVQLCVDQADVLLLNDGTVQLRKYREALAKYVALVTGERPRYPSPLEILMNLAYSAAHGSKCLKRQVGAVLVDAPPGEMGDIVGQGFNENPVRTRSCAEEPKYGADPARSIWGRCHRDLVRYESFVQLARRKCFCPNCGKPISEPSGEVPPWRCQECSVNLEEFFWPERAMSLCTAVHAEVSAIIAAGLRCKGSTLYATTFPCFQCAEKISHVGVKNIVFTEPYPDIRAAERLQIAGIGAVRFQGVRSRRFDEIFSRARPYVSEELRARARASG